jgi:hypothetical protein
VDPITIALAHKGAEDVKTALRGVQDAIVELDRTSVSSGRRASAARVSSMKKEGSAREKRERTENVRREYKRALGGAGGGDVRRASSGPALTSMPGASGGGGLANVIGKAGAAGAAFGVMVSAIDMASSALQEFGGFLISDVVKPSFALEKFAAQLQNSSGGAVKAQTVMDKSRAIQARWNVDAMDAAQSAATLADKTGNMDVAFAAVADNAMLSQGYGAGMGELAELSAAIFNLDQKMGKEGLQKAMFTQLAQGQVAGGRFTIKDIAGLGGELVKNASRLTGDSDSRLASIGAALQTGGITGKADVSMGNLNSFIAEAAVKLKGTSAVNEKGQVGDLGDAIRQVLIKTGGNAGKLKSMQYSDTSTSFIMQYMNDFQEALKGGATAAEAAARATAVFETMRTAVANEKSVREAANLVMMTSGERYQTAINAIKDKLYSLMPQISALAGSLANKAPQLASAAMLLTRAFIAAGNLLEKLLPETDTRLKRGFEREEKKQKIATESAKLTADIEGIDKSVADRKDARRLQSYAILGTYDAQTAELEASKAAKQAQLTSLGARYAELEQPEPKEEARLLVESMVAAGDAKRRAGVASIGGSDERKATALARAEDRDRTEAAQLLDDIKAAPNMDILDRARRYGPENVSRISKFRDENLDASEGRGSDASDSLNTSADKLAAAADALQAAASTSKDANRTTPIGQR